MPFLTDATYNIKNHVLRFFFHPHFTLYVSVKELFSLWADQNYPPLYTSFVPLPLFAVFHYGEIVTWSRYICFRTASFMTFFISLYLCVCPCVCLSLCLYRLFGTVASVWQCKELLTCNKLFWNISRIVSHTSHFKAHSH